MCMRKIIFFWIMQSFKHPIDRYLKFILEIIYFNFQTIYVIFRL